MLSAPSASGSCALRASAARTWVHGLSTCAATGTSGALSASASRPGRSDWRPASADRVLAGRSSSASTCWPSAPTARTADVSAGANRTTFVATDGGSTSTLAGSAACGSGWTHLRARSPPTE